MILLCIAAIEDDHDRFFMEQLYYKYQRLMYSVIQRYTRDPWDADDIFQSTLPKLIDKLTLLKTLKRSKLTNYIISTCKNTAFNYLEKKSNRKEFSLDDLTTFPSSKEDPYQLHLSESDDVDAFRRAWLKLDARSQYLLEARYILNKSYDKIALELNIKPSSVRVAMTRTKEKAKRLILAEKASAQVKETV